jgi:hypothetical protein
LKVTASSLTSSEPVTLIRSLRSVDEIRSAVALSSRSGCSSRPATNQPTPAITASEISDTKVKRCVMSAISRSFRASECATR